MLEMLSALVEFFNEIITSRAVQSSFVCDIGLCCRDKVPEIMCIVRLFD